MKDESNQAAACGRISGSSFILHSCYLSLPAPANRPPRSWKSWGQLELWIIVF
jgi:hypothetical protein